MHGSVVNRVAKCELGEKMIVCGRGAIGGGMSRLRTELTQDGKCIYRKVVNGREDLWDEYCRLCKEVNN